MMETSKKTTPLHKSGPAVRDQEAQKPFDEIVLDIKREEKAKGDGNKSVTLMGLYTSLNEWLISLTPIKSEEILLFFQLLAAVLNAGISVDAALELLEAQTPNERLRLVIHTMRELIMEGESLAGAMRRNDDVFDEATCSIIDAGEKSGKLNEVLKELVGQYERMNTIRKKVKGVLTYPVIVLIVMALLTVVVMVFVVPKLIELFGSAESLPLPTRILIAGSDLFITNWWLLILILVVAG